jgi:5-methyltetrahydrofolate--homocysteine methyltransferase
MPVDLHEIFTRYPKSFPLPMLLDGSTGTSLMREGMPAGYCTEKWVLEHPNVLKKIQHAYIESGSDAIYTPTFGANRPTLERSNLNDPSKINTELASLSVGCNCLAGGDMSPTGLFIEPFGDTPFDEIVKIYREQAEALDRAGVDFFISETNISLQEARAAVIGIREVSEKPIFVTMTVDENGRTLSGDSLICSLLALSELGISAFGINCSQGPDGMIENLRRLVPYSLSLGIPLIAKPNAGLPHEDSNGLRHFDLDSDSFSAFIPEFLTAGIPILGGCCGTDATYIDKIRKCIDKLSPTLDYSNIPRTDTTSLACTNREITDIDLTLSIEPVAADENFYDNAAFAEGDYLLVHLPDQAAADIFIENAPMLTLPCALTGHPDAIKKALRYYNGRLIIVLN